MARIGEVLEFLKTLIHSSNHDTVRINKAYLSDIKPCLQNAHEKIEFLQRESQLQQAELQQWSHHSELVSVQKIETDSHKQQVSNVAVDSNLVPSSKADLYAYAEAQGLPPKPIIRPL